MTKIHEIDPLTDERWAEFLGRHQSATLFHSKEWLDALGRTYGYRAGVLTTSGPGERLSNALVFCRIQSWLTGCRLVSVPFSDHCAPLINNEEELACLVSGLKQERVHEARNYLEIRSGADGASMGEGLDSSTTFCLHRLDLSPSLSDLFHAFHVSCIRRKIVRAQREGLTYEEGTSEDLLQRFYQLAVLTRRRHQIPPQPLSWYRNLIACLGDKVKLRLASREGKTAAGILTIRYKSTMTYKYGCSDPQFHSMGPMQLLMWKTIKEAKRDGLLELDMGRTDWNNKGLLTYKDRWGGVRSTLRYFRYPASKPQDRTENFSTRIARRIVTLAPDSVLTTAGSMLYRHIG